MEHHCTLVGTRYPACWQYEAKLAWVAGYIPRWFAHPKGLCCLNFQLSFNQRCIQIRDGSTFGMASMLLNWRWKRQSPFPVLMKPDVDWLCWYRCATLLPSCMSKACRCGKWKCDVIRCWAQPCRLGGYDAAAHDGCISCVLSCRSCLAINSADTLCQHIHAVMGKLSGTGLALCSCHIHMINAHLFEAEYCLALFCICFKYSKLLH